MNNEIKINVPEGMEIDKEKSTFECIKFKPKWVPKRGDIAAAGYDHCQIILVSKYIRQCSTVGFDIECLAVMNTNDKNLTLFNNRESGEFWVSEEASASEKEVFINELNKLGYVYDPDDSRIIYKKKSPKTWKEFCQNNPITHDEYYINSFSLIKSANSGFTPRNRDCFADANSLPSEEYAEAMLALCKLIQLRDCYNDGWKPDWEISNTKYAIKYYCNRIVRVNSQGSHCLLTFKTEDLRNAFLENFKYLIEQAKLLL